MIKTENKIIDVAIKKDGKAKTKKTKATIETNLGVFEEELKQVTIPGCEDETPVERQEKLERELIDIEKRKIVVEGILKGLKDVEKGIKQEILVCMRENKYPLLKMMEDAILLSGGGF